MSISLITRDDFVLDSRLDAEHYSKELMDNLHYLEKYSQKKELLKSLTSFIKKGIFYILKEEYVDDGIPFIRVSNTNDIFISKKDLTFITLAKHKAEKKTRLTTGDLVVSKSGTLGNVSIIPEEFNECNISQDIIGISVNKEKINPYYLLAYLKSKFGQFQLERGKSQAVQAHLNLDALRELIVILLDNKIQKEIQKILLKAYNSKKEAEEIFKKAEDLLLNSINFKKDSFSKDIISVASHKEFTSRYMFNAEYYLKKYRELEITIVSKPHSKLKDSITISTKKIKPEKKPDKKFNYVAIADVDGSAGMIKSFSSLRAFQLPGRARLIAKEGDVLVPYLGGSSGNTALVHKKIEDLVVTTGFYVIGSQELNSETLFLLFRSPIMINQIERLTTGAIMSSINRGDFEKLLIPKVQQIIQKELSEQIRKYFKLRDEATENLKEAISIVERGVIRENE